MTVAIIGLDLSAQKLAATITIDEKKLLLEALPLKDKQINIRCSKAYDWGLELCSQVSGDDIYAFVEAPIVWNSSKSTIVLSQVSGAVQAGLTKGLATVYEVNNQTWKRIVVRNPHAKKPEIAKVLSEIWPNAYTLADKDQDLIDSACINRYGAGVMKLRRAVMQPRRRRRIVRRAHT